MIDAFAVTRAIHLAATTVAAGMIFFELVIARAAFGDREPIATGNYFGTLHRWICAALAITAVSGLAWAMLVAAQVDDAPVMRAFIDGTFGTLLTETRFGQVWLGRALLLLVTVAAVRSGGKSAPWLGLIAAGGLLGAVAWVGHSGASTGIIGWLQVDADVAHLLAAGLWLGSLPALAILLARQLPGEAIGAATRRFSGFGMAAVATLLLTGLTNTYFLTDSIWNLPQTDYGQLLLLKIGLFAAMLAFAAVNRWYWTPRLPENAAVAAIRRHSLIEAGLGLAVLFVVGILGTLPPPLHRHIHLGDAVSDGAFVHIHDIRAMAEVRLVPGTPGANEAEIRLMREDFTPMPARAVTLHLAQPGELNRTAGARDGGGGLWRTPSVALRTPGVWTVTVEVETDDGSTLTLDGPIVINNAKSE